MTWNAEQDQIGRCDFLDVLEEASVSRQRVDVELRSGRRFHDRVSDVITEKGREFVEFEMNGRVPLEEVKACTRAQIEHTYPTEMGPSTSSG